MERRPDADPIWIEDAASEFDISRSSLQRYIRAGRLASVQRRDRTTDKNGRSTVIYKIFIDRHELAGLFKGLEVWDRKESASTAPRHPGGRPIGSKAKRATKR
jgi:hypothetical protein